MYEKALKQFWKFLPTWIQKDVMAFTKGSAVVFATTENTTKYLHKVEVLLV